MKKKEGKNSYKKYDVWEDGKCPKCGTAFRYTFEHIEERVGRRTCICGYYDEYEMSPVRAPQGESLPWPRYDPVEYVCKKIRSQSEDSVDYGDYVESW